MRSSTGVDNRSESFDSSELLRPQLTHPQPRLPRMLAVECHDDEINGERFGTVLGIRCDPRKGFQLVSKQKVGKYSAVERVFSMRRSTSVSEGYCRIQDLSDTPSMDEEGGSSPMKLNKQQHKGGKIIKTCKSFFNLK